MPSPVGLLLLVLGSMALPASALDGEVYLRASTDALLVRVTDADLSECELLRPSPETVVLVVHGMRLTLPSPRDRFELARTLRVVEPSVLGADESRLVIELFTSATTATLEEIDSGILLTLRLPVEHRAVEAAPEPPPRPAEAADPTPRPISTPWRRARVRAQQTREGGPAPAEAEEAVRAAREAEEAERLRKREARERRVETRAMTGVPEALVSTPEAPAPTAPPAPAEAPQPRAPEPARPPAGAPPQRLPERTGPAQPSPATPLPADMVRVPGGPFRMGSPAGEGFEDEEPQHVVDVAPFWIDSHEVTVGDFRHSPIRLPEQPEWNVADDLPVVNVTWYEAAEYCDWLGKRLPTEAEWEKAARGDDGRRYPWGDGWAESFANSGVAGDGFERTAPVGSFPDGASPSGAVDMAGNAWEWTGDWHDAATYKSTRRDHTSPKGPSRGAEKVVRGGSFRGAHSVNVRSAIRQALRPATRRDDVGFRCASEPR